MVPCLENLTWCLQLIQEEICQQVGPLIFWGKDVFYFILIIEITLKCKVKVMGRIYYNSYLKMQIIVF